MRSLVSLFIIGLMLSCTATQSARESSRGTSSDSHAKILEVGDKLYAFRMPVDSISKCFFKNYNDIQLINHYINYDKINGNEVTLVNSRKVTKRNALGIIDVGLENQENKEIVMKVSIDKLGRVIAAELLEGTTAVLSQEQRRKILAQVLVYQYQSDEDAPCIESGKLTVFITKIKTIK